MSELAERIRNASRSKEGLEITFSVDSEEFIICLSGPLLCSVDGASILREYKEENTYWNSALRLVVTCLVGCFLPSALVG